MRALAALKRDGLVERIGLCNVGLKQLEEALRLAEIDAVQVELSVLHDDSLWNGVAQRCLAERIPLVAYRPLGGYDKRAKLARDPVLVELAARHGATPFEMALAWLRSLSPLVLPIPGATRLESLRSSCGPQRSRSTTPIASGSTSASRRRASSAASAPRGRPWLSPTASWCW